VFTSLTKEALPIVSYRTRDLTRLLPPSSRSMRRMAKIVGRSVAAANSPSAIICNMIPVIALISW